MGQHTISTEDAKRLGRALLAYERSPQNYLPPIERKVRIGGGGSGGDSGGGSGGLATCDCAAPIEVGVVDIDGVKFSEHYMFSDPLGMNGFVTVSYDEELGYWVSDDYEFECDLDPPPEEE